MQPLTQVQNPKQARSFPVNSTVPAVSALRFAESKLPGGAVQRLPGNVSRSRRKRSLTSLRADRWPSKEQVPATSRYAFALNGSA
jgi:hypothetical protein